MASQFVDACHETFELIAEHPGIGRVYEPLNERLVGMRVFRVHGFDAWRVCYQPLEVVRVERVLHGARDLPRVLEEPWVSRPSSR